MKTGNFIHLKQGLFLLFYLITIQLQAQQDTVAYIPIPDNALWSVNSLKFKTMGDTVINSKNYLKVYWQDENAPFEFDVKKASYCCAIRNDTAAKRVYGVYKEATEVVYKYKNGTSYKYNSTDTSEFLLYDFSLKTGDTVWAASFFDTTFSSYIVVYQFVCVLNSDSSILLNDSSYRKKINMDINIYCGDNNQYWIEGIGSTNGFFTPAIPPSGLEIQPRHLLCFAVNDEQLIQFPEYDYDTIPDDCYSIGNGSNINEIGSLSKFKLFPNPAQNQLWISNEKEIIKGLTIYDVVGKEVKRFSVNTTKTTLDVSDLVKGVYLVKAKTETGIETKKFIKE